VLGYTWDCQAEITVTPTPFAGTFTLDDDASNISNGTAQFLSTSDPNACQGLGTDQLSCVFDGATMTAPQTVTYQLFTELTDPNEPIEWENCVKGYAESVLGQVRAVPMCVGQVIKPEVKLDEPKEITLKKDCGLPVDSVQNGVAGKLWSCEVNVTATPAPFAGSFSFFEDASTVSGTNSANIIGYTAGNTNWACLGTFPQQQTLCSLPGSSFSPSGTETISFDLFAADEGNAVKWQNCVRGIYQTDAGKESLVEGNCADTGWDSTQKKPPVFEVKKNCLAVGVQNGNAFYACSIDVLQTGGAPITAPLIFDEMFSTTSGASATQYILNLQGTPSMPNGWNCQLPPFANSASCSISAANFNGNTGHRIDALISIPTGVLAKEGFDNCAQVRIGDQVVGSADCVDIGQIGDTTFKVEKSCAPSGERQNFSPTIWFQPYQCTLTVTTNGVPFTGPLWIVEDLHFGASSGAASIQNITSADPWSCSNPPYTASGQGNDPACGIQGAQFPASGTSSITVDLTMNAAMDYFGAENCVSLSVGEPTAAGLPAPVASDCFEIAPPPTPTLDLTKTCSRAVRGANNLWTAQCEVTVSGTNLPAGQSISINDELTGSGQTTVNSGSFDPSPFTGPNCTSSANAGWIGATCEITTDQIMGNGGSVTLPYTATLVGHGRLTNAPGQNCASADSAGLGLHAPATGGMACVAIPLVLRAIPGTGGVILDPHILVDPAGPTPGTGGVNPGPIFGTGTLSVPDIATPSATITKICEPLIFAVGAQTADAICAITINTRNLVPGQVVTLSDALTIGNSAPTVPHQGPFMNVLNSPIWACGDAQPAGTSAGQCYLSTDVLISAGGTTVVTWTANLLRDNVHQHRGIKNCATLTIAGIPPVTSCANFEVSYASKTPTPPVPAATTLTFIKEQTSPCNANRNSQTYDCGFRLGVTNTGTTPYLGPLVMTDMGGAPGMTSARAVSGNGWTCGRAVANSVSCTNPALRLAPGASTFVDLRMQVKGLRRGGAFPNCGIVGVTENRTQRVALIQKIMNDRGYKAGGVDGAPGRRTFAALARLRKDLGLPINRKFDDALFKALGLPLQKPGTSSCVSAKLPAMPPRFIAPAPKPAPSPSEPALKCDPRSTYLRGDICACIDHRNAKNISKTQCGCTNGLPMINGKCIAIDIAPKPSGDGPAGAERCRIKLNGVCLK
jgi:hypothetical protein